MQVVNVKTLRAELSRCLEAVKKGGTIEVRERHTPIARIVPIGAKERRRKDSYPAWALEMERKGVIALGNPEGVAALLRRPLLRLKDARLLDALIEERRSGR